MRTAPQLRAQALDDPLLLLDALAPRARQPVLRAQLVEQGPLHTELAVRFETHPALGIEALDRRDQPDVAGGVQVAAVHALGQPPREAAHDVRHQFLVGLDE